MIQTLSYDSYAIPNKKTVSKIIHPKIDLYNNLEKKYSFQNQEDQFSQIWRKYVENTVIVLTTPYMDLDRDLEILNNYYRKGYKFRFRYTFINCLVGRIDNKIVLPIQFSDLGNTYIFIDYFYDDFVAPITKGRIFTHPHTFICELHSNPLKMHSNLLNSYNILQKYIKIEKEKFDKGELVL
jgi:hypothetical protein